MVDLGIRGDNRQFIEAAVQNGLDFIVIGGAAVAFHGCRDAEDVRDLDILIAPEANNVVSLINSFRSMNVSLNLAVDDLAAPNKQISIRRNCEIDVLTPKIEEDYTHIKQDSIEAVIGMTRVKVVCRTDLIDMKLRTITESKDNISKHEKDLSCLQAI